MTEIRSQIFFGDLRLKNELHYNGDSRARRLCLELRRMISATSFSLTHSPHLLTSFSLSHSHSPPWIQPPSPYYLTLSLSHSLLLSYFPIFLHCFILIFWQFCLPFWSHLFPLEVPNSGLPSFQTFSREYNCSSIFVSISIFLDLKTTQFIFTERLVTHFVLGQLPQPYVPFSTTCLFLNLFSSHFLNQISKFFLVHNLSFKMFTLVLKISGQKYYKFWSIFWISHPVLSDMSWNRDWWAFPTLVDLLC